MSQVRDIFYQLLKEKISDKSYVFKKSSGDFEKTNKELKYIIRFSWDGRGGTTYINSLSGVVQLSKIANASKKILAYELPVNIVQPRKPSHIKEYQIPQMYSRGLIELANDMKFKEMSVMPFEEKYPMRNISRTAEVVTNFINNEIIPFHNLYYDERQILDEYIKMGKEKYDQKDYHNISFYVFPIKLMCKKLKIEEPDFTKNINLFTNKSIDDLWNIQNHDFENLEHKFNNILF